MYLYIYIYMYTLIAYVCTYMTYIYIYTYTYTHIHMYTHIVYIYIYTYVYIYCIHIHITHMYIYIYIYTQCPLPFCRRATCSELRWVRSWGWSGSCAQTASRHAHPSERDTVSFQKFNPEASAKPLGDSNVQRACWSEHKAMVLGFEILALKFGESTL